VLTGKAIEKQPDGDADKAQSARPDKGHLPAPSQE
jgi:hypothetical protein